MNTSIEPDAAAGFAGLGLSEPVLRAIDAIGYESPSPIQAAAIGPLLAGRDLIGQAQTGTGKTAAFALPLLSRLDLARAEPQALVITPTRELAIQVAEALQTYARFLPGFHVLPVYGGQSLGLQLRPLRRGVHAVVGTPGRILDHLERGTLRLDAVRSVVLDEADEMLRMGFIDDVEQILQRTPDSRQVALFSATLPPAIQHVARRHTRDAEHVRIESRTATVATVSQQYWPVSGLHKLDALTRILEVEDFDAMVVFVRTKTATAELAERLEARGFSAAALNGDMNQAAREQAIERLKTGRLDILVATDVAARGLDVERISHVVNYDIPYDTEAYVHRIGRTARAGRSGKAILFVAPRERRMLRAIERATGQRIDSLQLPSQAAVAERRTARFTAAIDTVLANEDLDQYEAMLARHQAETGASTLAIAAALAHMARGGRPLFAGTAGSDGGADERCDASRAHGGMAADAAAGDTQQPRVQPRRRQDAPGIDTDAVTSRTSGDRSDRRANRAAPPAPAARSADGPAPAHGRRDDHGGNGRGELRPAAAGRTRYRIEVGASHGAGTRHIVGAIANEAGLDGEHIGPIRILDDHSIVDLPSGMPKDIYKHLRGVWVCGQRLAISVEGGRRPQHASDADGERSGSARREESSEAASARDAQAAETTRPLRDKGRPGKARRTGGRAGSPGAKGDRTGAKKAGARRPGREHARRDAARDGSRGAERRASRAAQPGSTPPRG